jgi:peptidoglycan/xylan/chitin deacetylase (PgdA/CDA1 family)
MYHGVPRSGPGLTGADFERHVLFLKRHFEMVAPDWCGAPPKVRRALGRVRVAITFDDGFRSNAEVAAPILRRHKVPALFFVSSRHSQPGRYLWFSYLRTLERAFKGESFRFRGESWDMTPASRPATVRRLWEQLLAMKPHPTAMYHAIDEELPRLEEHAGSAELNDVCAGMTEEQVGELASDPLFSVGCHTVDHPFLTRCDEGEARRQLAVNKAWLERISGKPCQSVSYPGGDYNAQTLAVCQSLGFNTGYSVDRSLRQNAGMEIQRWGVYAPSTNLLGFKVVYGALMRKLGMAVG